MKTPVKKMVALLLSVCMLLGLFPMASATHIHDGVTTADAVRSSSAFSVGKSGKYVIAALVDGVYYAMSNSFSAKISGTPIAVSNGTVSESAAAGYAVTLTYSGGSYTIQNDTHYLTYSSSTNLGAATTAYTWTVSQGINGSWRIASVGTNTRGVVFRAKDYNQFGGYALSNCKAGSAEYFDVEILAVGGTATACDHSSTTTATTPATCTTPGKQTVTCKKCGVTLSTTNLPATGHSYRYSPKGDGTHTVRCSACNLNSVEACSLSSGKCRLCGWTSGSGSTGEFQLITAANQITDGKYVLVVAPGGANPGSYPYYAMIRQMHSTSYVMAEGLKLSGIPQTMTVTNDLMIWELSGDSNGFTLSGSDGSVLYHSSNNLYYGEDIATSWTATYVDGAFTLNADTRYLGLRDDLATVDSNGNPCFRCNSSAKTSSYRFYLFKSGAIADPECPHTNTYTNLTPATCTQNGLMTVICKDCGGTIKSETVEATGHNSSYVEGIPAGCKTDGRIPHYVCTNCNGLFGDTLCINALKASDIIVPAIGHTVYAVGGLAATCGTEGMMAHYHCKGCGAYFLDEKATKQVALTDLTIPALGHDLVETPASPATCAHEGNITYYTCEECNAIFSDEACQNQIHLIDTVIPSLNHTLSYSPVKEATCTSTGVYAYYYCAICDIYYSDSDSTETIAKEDLTAPALGHDVQFTKEIKPSCTESGAIAHYYCNRCHKLFSDAQGKNSITQQDILIPPAGHSYNKTVTPPTCTTEGMEEFTCSACGDFYSVPVAATGHSYVNGVCTSCGAGHAAVDTTILINHNLNLASDISINFAVRTDLLTSYDSYYLEVRVPVYTGNSLESYRTVQIKPVLNGMYYYFTLTGMTAIQIGDEVQAVLHMTKGGAEYISNTDYYSVAEYAYAQLNKTTTKESLNRLCANLLQYGTAAQVYKNYRTNAYADAGMTTAHRAYLTDISTITFTNHNRTLSDLANPTVLWQGKALILDSKITVKYVINTGLYTGSINDLSLRIQYLDYTGKSQTVILRDPQPYGNTAGWYCFDFDSLLAAELRQVLSAAVYQGNTRVSQTMEYSVESYGYNRTGTLLALCKAMMAYSDTALAFFNS